MTPGQIANDLRAQSKAATNGMCINRALINSLAIKMERGAEAIEQLLKVIADLEGAAENEARRFEAYRNGEDHG